MLCARSAIAARPAFATKASPVRSVRVVVRSSPQELEKETAKALKAAEEVCKSGTTEVGG